jgi:alpha-L-rhamnosidase
LKTIVWLCILLGTFSAYADETQSSVIPVDLLCEYRTNPLGMEAKTPRFSWTLCDPDCVRGQKQTAYRVLVASDSTQLSGEQADVWDSGRVVSAQSVLVPFGGRELSSARKYYWKVQVYDKNGAPSAWSEPASFVTGLLDAGDWLGSWWIRHPDAPEGKHVWFRRKFNLPAPVRSAFIHVASAGYHELYVNGRKADDRVLAPALTRLSKRVMYVTYDLSHLLEAGDNVIALWQAPGWANYEFYGLPSCLRVQLGGETLDGKTFALPSDNDWRCAVSNSENLYAIMSFGHNAGERIDARADVVGWNQRDFDDSAWADPKYVDFPAELCAHAVDPTRVIDTLRPLQITGDGPFRIDLGRNFTGWVDLEMSGLSPGDTVMLQVSNEPQLTENFNQRNVYIASGAARERFCNRFNYLAGRYVTVEGLKQRPRPEDVTGYALSTALRRTGNFTSSNRLFNRIYETDLWTFLANTTEGFTSDCPHRERLGYGEVAFATAWGIGLPNFRSGDFYHKVVRDWTDVQEPNGWIHHTAPQVNRHYGGVMWSSAGLNIAWEHYLHYGDKQILECIYPTARRWLEFLHAHTKDGLLTAYSDHWGRFLGDWAAPEQRSERGDSPQALLFNNCVYVMNLETTVKMAELLGHSSDAALYAARLAALRTRVHEVFFRPETNTYADGFQVHQAFPLLTGITPENLRPAVLAHFEKEFAETHPYFDMGSSGLPVLLHFLVAHPEFGETAARHLAQTTEPSYGYFLQRGETAWPEYWNVDVPSRIHTCYTGIASWFVKSLCGIQPDAVRPGYQSFLIRPVVVSEATFAEASVESPYGRIDSRWERKKRKVELSVTVPPNTTATVYIPARRPDGITEGGVDIRKVPGIAWKGMEGDYAVVSVEAGRYTFVSPFEIHKPK